MQTVLSREVQKTRRSESRQIVAPIQANGTGIPLFLVSPGIESVSFVRCLGPEQPVFAVRVPDVPQSAVRSLDEIASILAREIRAARPSGPYAFAGWCAAGVLAVEIARKMDQLGEAVAFAAVLDARTTFLPQMNPGARMWVRSYHYVQKVGFFLKGVATRGLKPVRDAVDGRIYRMRRVARRMRGVDPPDAVLQGLKNYNPTRWEGRVVHVWAEERPRGRYRDPQFAWGAVSPSGFKFYEVPGNHITMLEEPSVGRVAMILQRELRAARQVPRIRKALSESRAPAHQSIK